MVMTLKDLLTSGKSREEINAILSGQTIGTDGFDPQGTTGQGAPYMPPPELPQNYIRNNSTGSTYDMGQSQPSPAMDYSQAPVELGGYGKGYRVKGDPTRVILADGRIVRMGADTGADRARTMDDLKLAQTRQQLATGGIEQQMKQAELQNGRKGTVPAGYRMTPEGNMEPVPGGPADFKQQGKFNQDVASMSATEAALNSLAEKANQVKAHPGLDAATGWQTLFPTMPGSKAADAESQLDTLKSKVAFGTLQAMRDASKTGGALGAVSEKELKLLESNIDALSTAQSPEQFRKSLEAIVKYSEDAKGRARGAFNMTHGGEKKSGAAVPVKSEQDAMRLPAGTRFQLPDGRTGTVK